MMQNSYKFDKVFNQSHSQLDIYEALNLASMVNSVLDVSNKRLMVLIGL